MVIVLTGMQSINKKYLARLFLSRLNKFEYKDYTCDFEYGDFKIYDKDNRLVYKTNTDENEGVNTILTEKGIEEFQDVFNYFNNLDTELFERGVKHNHFVNVFCSLEVDYGLSTMPEYEYVSTKLRHPHDFFDVVMNLKKSKLEYKVISGTFGSHFLNKLKAFVPNEEFIIFNFQRNPSVSFLFNKKPETKWLTEINPDLTEDIDTERFYESILNSIELAKRDDIITIKFEDFAREGKIKLKENLEFDIREDYKLFNKWITNGEHDLPIIMTKEEFEPFNDYISNYSVDKFYNNEEDDVKLYNKSFEQIYEIFERNIPKNIFTTLGYTPLSYEEILEER